MVGKLAERELYDCICQYILLPQFTGHYLDVSKLFTHVALADMATKVDRRIVMPFDMLLLDLDYRAGYVLPDR